MSDRIIVDGIEVFAHHGVLPDEAETGQTFFISLDCDIDLSAAAGSDDLARTVSYADLAALAHAVATERRYQLIEALAGAVAAAILGRFAPIEAVTVRVDKPSAPMPVAVGNVAVAITRRRAVG